MDYKFKILVIFLAKYPANFNLVILKELKKYGNICY